MRRAVWIRRTAVLIAAYLAIMAGATLWMGVWHDWDWGVLRWLSGMHAPTFSPNVVVLDVAGYNQDKPQIDRQVIADFLQSVNRGHEKPAAILIDFYFESIDSAHAPAATAALKKALEDSTRAGLQVYGTIAKPDLLAEATGEPNWQTLKRLDWSGVYDQFSGGFGHTILNLHGADGVFYQTCYARVPKFDKGGSRVGETAVRALPILAAVEGAAAEAHALPDCDPSKMKIVRLGPPGQFASTQISDKKPYPQHIDLTGKFVIVATVAGDVLPGAARSNPELIAWALSDLLMVNPGEAYYQPLPLGDMLLVLIAIFSLLAVVAFVAIFQGLRRLRLGKLRSHLPWVAAALAALATLALFGGLEAFLLALPSRSIPPQVSLVAVSIIVTAGLSGQRGRQMLGEELVLPPGDAHDSDVFISYAHSELDWVKEKVLAPLNQARLANGDPLRIFIDENPKDGIRISAAWIEELHDAIKRSRFMVAVISDNYFERPWCKEEFTLAYAKWVQAGASFAIFPIVRGHPKVPAFATRFQVKAYDEESGIVEHVVGPIVEQLNAERVVQNDLRGAS